MSYSDGRVASYEDACAIAEAAVGREIYPAERFTIFDSAWPWDVQFGRSGAAGSADYHVGASGRVSHWEPSDVRVGHPDGELFTASLQAELAARSHIVNKWDRDRQAFAAAVATRASAQ